MLDLPSSILAETTFGSPRGVTAQDAWVRHLWHISYYFAIPVGAITWGLILWAFIRYRKRPGDTRRPKQFQYHIPLELLYTTIPIVIVAIIFGYMYQADSKVDAVAKNPPVEIKVEGFQWGWRFTYLTVNGDSNGVHPNFQEVGSVANEPNLNDDADLPVLTLPEGETIQFDLYTDDVNHSFYIPEALFKRDLIQGVKNTVDMKFVTTGSWIGECTQFCGTYHPYMRFTVHVMPADQFNSWASQQQSGSVTYAGQTAGSGINPNVFNSGATTK